MQVLEACKVELGEGHPDTLRAMANLAIIMQQLGRSTEAERLQV